MPPYLPFQGNPGASEVDQSNPLKHQPGHKEWKPVKFRKGLTHPEAKRVQEVENGTTVGIQITDICLQNHVIN